MSEGKSPAQGADYHHLREASLWVGAGIALAAPFLAAPWQGGRWAALAALTLWTGAFLLGYVLQEQAAHEKLLPDLLLQDRFPLWICLFAATASFLFLLLFGEGPVGAWLTLVAPCATVVLLCGALRLTERIREACWCGSLVLLVLALLPGHPRGYLLWGLFLFPWCASRIAERRWRMERKSVLRDPAYRPGRRADVRSLLRWTLILVLPLEMLLFATVGLFPDGAPRISIRQGALRGPGGERLLITQEGNSQPTEGGGVEGTGGAEAISQARPVQVWKIWGEQAVAESARNLKTILKWTGWALLLLLGGPPLVRQIRDRLRRKTSDEEDTAAAPPASSLPPDAEETGDRPGAEEDPRQAVILCYNRLRRKTAHLLPQGTSRTPLEYANWIASRFPDRTLPIQTLTCRFHRACYSLHPVSSEEARAAHQEATRTLSSFPNPEQQGISSSAPIHDKEKPMTRRNLP
jgi:hypothetical protein